MPLARAPIVQVTIANGTSLSGGVEIGAALVKAIQLPTITSASLTFQGSFDGTTWVELVDATNTALSFPASTGGQIMQVPVGFLAPPWLKIRSGTSGAPVNQGAGRVISIVLGA